MVILSSTSSSSSGMGSMLIMMAVLIAIMYFLMIRPQRKEQKRIDEMLKAMEVGDAVVTNSGFYGVLIDVGKDDCIVEFGNNRNCRIPMKKTAIAQVEKPADAVAKTPEKDTKSKNSSDSKDTKKK
ncbi:MAG: preprotein translocase subunit YajC [Bilifractor sp.]